MKRISGYFISLLAALTLSLPGISQDTLDIPLKIRIGLEVTGPAIWFAEKNILNTEAYLSADLNEKRSVMLGAGFLDYRYSQYNYDYRNKGFFVRTGMDFNLLATQKANGIYWAGIGLHYGLSRFTSETPYFQKDNYWGTVISAIDTKKSWGHFVEVAPGVRAEVLRNFSIGWTMSMRLLLYNGSDKNLRPIYFPGFGNGGKKVSSGINYFLIWNIPYKRIRVIIKPEEPEPSEEDLVPAPPGSTTTSPGYRF